MSLKTTERRQYTDTNVSRIIAFSLLYIDSRLRYIIYVLTALAPRLPDSHVSATARTSACPRTATGRTAAAWSASHHLLLFLSSYVVDERSRQNRDRLRRRQVESLADADPQRPVLVQQTHLRGLLRVRLRAGHAAIAQPLQLEQQVEEPALGEAQRVGVRRSAGENGEVGDRLRQQALCLREAYGRGADSAGTGTPGG